MGIHYSKTGGLLKGIKHYFLEFLMMFLAVTMGFFAENYREQLTKSKQRKGVHQVND